jgi:hypothetical protein
VVEYLIGNEEVGSSILPFGTISEAIMQVGDPCEMPESKCPECGTELNMASSVGTKSKPEPGDMTVCLICGHYMAFDKDLSLRDLTDDEILDVAHDPRIVAIQNARKKVFGP